MLWLSVPVTISKKMASAAIHPHFVAAFAVISAAAFATLPASLQSTT